MEKVIIMLDFAGGPIWTNYYDKESDRLPTGIDIIDENEELWELNEEIQDLFSSYYKFNYMDEVCFFDKAQEKADKDKMLSLLEKLIARLNEINDGSFEIEDRETERVKSL